MKRRKIGWWLLWGGGWWWLWGYWWWCWWLISPQPEASLSGWRALIADAIDGQRGIAAPFVFVPICLPCCSINQSYLPCCSVNHFKTFVCANVHFPLIVQLTAWYRLAGDAKWYTAGKWTFQHFVHMLLWENMTAFKTVVSKIECDPPPLCSWCVVCWRLLKVIFCDLLLASWLKNGILIRFKKKCFGKSD